MGKKILILCNSCIGLYKFRKELLIELKNNDYDIYVSTPFDNLEIIELLKKMEIQLIETKIDRRGMNLLKDTKLLFYYLILFLKIKPNVILTYTIKPNLYGGILARFLNIPYIINITGLGTAVEVESKLQKLLLLFYKKAVKKCKMIFFQNKANQDFFIQNISPKNYELVPGSGVNLEEYNFEEYPDDKILKFLFVARIMKEKGIEFYLEVAKKIKIKYPNTEFHICGFCEENYKEIIEELVNKNIVIYHGQINNMKMLYKEIHCIIHPTYYPEGISNVLLEAAATGRGIITTNRPGCREVVDNYISGYLVKEKNEADLLEKVEKFIQLSYKEKKKIGLNARKKVENEFNRSIVVNSYIKILKELEMEGKEIQ